MRCVLTQLQARAAPCSKFPPARPNSASSVTAAARRSKSRSRSAGTSARAEWVRCSVICIRRFWPPTLIEQTPSPRVPSMLWPGKVRRRACGSHTSVSNNVRMRGRACPEAWVMPVPERVGPKVKANPHQSQLSRSVEEDWKRGRNVRTPAALARGALS